MKIYKTDLKINKKILEPFLFLFKHIHPNMISLFGIFLNYSIFKLYYKDYSKIIEINPRDVDAYLSRSELSLYATDNVYESSKFKLNDLNKVLEIDPNNAYAHVSIGMHKQIEENYVGAIASFTKAVESDPTHDSAYSFRAESK